MLEDGREDMGVVVESREGESRRCGWEGECGRGRSL